MEAGGEEQEELLTMGFVIMGCALAEGPCVVELPAGRSSMGHGSQCRRGTALGVCLSVPL